jgi:hypothetical protein
MLLLVKEGFHLIINHLGGKRGFDECLGIEPREDVIAKNLPSSPERSLLCRKVPKSPAYPSDSYQRHEDEVQSITELTLLRENRSTWRISCSGVIFSA